MVFYVGVLLGLSHLGKNVGSKFFETGVLGKILVLRREM